MRKLALLSTALLGLAFAAPSYAQVQTIPSQAAPQPGLPPGAGVGTQNATPTGRSGQITTTAPGVAAASPTVSDVTTPAPVHRSRRHRVRHHRAHHAAAPAATTTAPAANQ